MSLAANFDHGCYAISGGSRRDHRGARDAALEGAQRLWFHHFFGTSSDYATYRVADRGSQFGWRLTLVATHIDPGGSALRVASAKLWRASTG
ncbi:MAG: hypothetical protein H6699_08575 [Myxococcales bacterium]|nr:hypothetical protein [Myxococcales bacterium]